MATIEQPTTGEAQATPRHRGLIAILAVVVLAVAGAVVWMIMSGDDEKTPTETMQELAAEMRDGDVDKVNALLVDGGPGDAEIFEFDTALKAEPTLSDCVERGGGGKVVSCDVTFGDDYFYSQVLGETLTGKLSGTVDENGLILVSAFGTSSGTQRVETELRAWVEQNRPELYDQMFDEGAMGGIRWNHNSGVLRTEILDEFMASR